MFHIDRHSAPPITNTSPLLSLSLPRSLLLPSSLTISLIPCFLPNPVECKQRTRNPPANLHLITTITTGDSRETTSSLSPSSPSASSYFPLQWSYKKADTRYCFSYDRIPLLSAAMISRAFFANKILRFPLCNGKSRGVYFRPDFNDEKFELRILFPVFLSIATDYFGKREWCKFARRENCIVRLHGFFFFISRFFFVRSTIDGRSPRIIFPPHLCSSIYPAIIQLDLVLLAPL